MDNNEDKNRKLKSVPITPIVATDFAIKIAEVTQEPCACALCGHEVEDETGPGLFFRGGQLCFDCARQEYVPGEILEGLIIAQKFHFWISRAETKIINEASNDSLN